MRAGPSPLPALEVAVGGGGHAIPRCGDVAVHAQAHRAAGVAPVESGPLEHLIETFALGLELDLLGAGDDHGIQIAGCLAALYHLRGRPQVPHPRVGARADEHAVELDLLHRDSGLKAHVLQRPLILLGVGLGDGLGHRDHHPRCGSPGDHRADGRGVDHDLAVEAGAFVAVERAPLLGQLLGRSCPPHHPLERGVVRRDHPGPATALDRHVAHGHAALHGQRLDRRARVLHHVTRGPGHADLADGGQDQVLGRNPESQRALVVDPHRARP